MLLRVLAWLALLAGGWWWLYRRLHPPGARAQARGQAPAPRLETMVDCAHCGLHLPASEALRDAGQRTYCCAQHLRAGPALHRP